MNSFDSPLLRFRCITTQQAITWILLSLLLGIGAIEALRYLALSGFSNLTPQSSIILAPFRDIIENRFDARIIAWIGSTLGFFWNLAGRELRKLDRLMLA